MAEEMLDSVVCSSEQFSFQIALKVMMVAELCAFGDEFQTAGAMILNALDWKLR